MTRPTITAGFDLRSGRALPRERFFALVGCGKAKRAARLVGTGCRADRLYTGGLFIASYRWARENAARVYILSARYGLLDPAQVVRSYDLKVTDLTQEERAAWGAGVRAGLVGLDRVPLLLAGSPYVRAVALPGALDVLAGLGLFARTEWLVRHPELTQVVLNEIKERQ